MFIHVINIFIIAVITGLVIFLTVKSSKRTKTETNNKIIFLIPLIVTSMLLLIEIVIKWFKYDLLDILTPFLYPLLLIAIYISITVMFIGIIVISIKNKDIFKKRKYWIPFILSLLTIIFVFLPIGELGENVRFQSLYGQYQNTAYKAIIGDYGEITEGENDILLPNEYQGLSRGGGETYVFKQGDDTAVFYYKIRGILDNFSGYVYLKDNKNDNDLLSNFGDWGKKEKIKDHWYCYYSR